MAYSTTNQPRLMVPRVGNAQALWAYSSADAASLVQVSGYFTDGFDLGMKALDIIWVTDNDASPPLVTSHLVVTSNATTVDLTAGVSISGSNSD